jgi:HrpA-like RNA helicase
MFNFIKMCPVSQQDERLLAEGNNYIRSNKKLSKYRINVSPLSETSRMGVPPQSVNVKCKKQREELPIHNYRQMIVDMIDRNDILLIVGSTGSGKTTQVPQYILENASAMNKPCRIVVCQPRRISAISVAERVAFERNEGIGTTVGYQIRLESRLSPNSNLIYCTNGVLLRCLMGANKPDELFGNVTHVVIDEVHERDRYSDFLLISIRDYLQHNPNSKLKVIIMSATIDSTTFTEYFHKCPLLEIPGKLFDVEINYLEDILKITNFSNKKVEDLKERFRKNEQHLLRLMDFKNESIMDSIKQKNFYENLDLETRTLLNETMENISNAENPEEWINQFFYLVEGENMPVDLRCESTNMTVLMILAGKYCGFHSLEYCKVFPFCKSYFS